MPQNIPSSADAFTFLNSNVQVLSEEIESKMAEDMTKLCYLALAKLKLENKEPVNLDLFQIKKKPKKLSVPSPVCKPKTASENQIKITFDSKKIH